MAEKLRDREKYHLQISVFSIPDNDKTSAIPKFFFV